MRDSNTQATHGLKLALHSDNQLALHGELQQLGGDILRFVHIDISIHSCTTLPKSGTITVLKEE